jgi:ribonucleoside-diphosphate reductase alpha chain
MQNEILGDVSFAAQYAKDMDDGRESWIDAVNRVEQMHLKKFANNFVDISDQIKWAFDLVREKRVFPSQRSMQFGGHAIMSNNMRIYNCTFSYCDRTRFFAEAFWLLLSGCGTGFSVRKKHVEKMPKLIPPKLMQSRPNKTYVIPDNIEGWADAVWCLINSYCLDCYYSIQYDHELVFDYSKIRLKGAPISSGGYAPGYRPLEIAIEKIRLRLQQMVMGTRSFSPIDCLDIAMYLSEAVLAGGVLLYSIMMMI